MRCVDFGWTSTWKTTAKASHGGRASLEYLKEHPEEDEVIHVVF